MTDAERLALSVETIELAKAAAEYRRRGMILEADLLAIRVAENAEQLATKDSPPRVSRSTVWRD